MLFAEFGNKLEKFRQRVRSRDDFQQPHVAHRIEKMGPQEVLPKLQAHPLGHGFERDSGGIGGDDRARVADCLDLLQEVLFDLQILNHDFNDPVTLGEPFKIIF